MNGMTPKRPTWAKDVVYAYVPRLTDKYGVGWPPRANEDPFYTWMKVFVKGDTSFPARPLASLDPELATQARRDPDSVIRLLIEQFDAVFILVLDGEISVFSLRRRPKLPSEFLHNVRTQVMIRPSDPVGWFSSLDATPVETVAAEAIFGSPPEDVEHEKARPKTSKNLSQKEVSRLRRRFWGGQTDPSLAPDIVDKLIGGS